MFVPASRASKGREGPPVHLPPTIDASNAGEEKLSSCLDSAEWLARYDRHIQKKRRLAGEVVHPLVSQPRLIDTGTHTDRQQQQQRDHPACIQMEDDGGGGQQPMYTNAEVII